MVHLRLSPWVAEHHKVDVHPQKILLPVLLGLFIVDKGKDSPPMRKGPSPLLGGSIEEILECHNSWLMA